LALPSAISLPPSLASMLETRMNLFDSPPPGLLQHEALLVGLDGQPDDVVGDCEEILLELAHQHDRPFDQAGDLIEQTLVLDQFEAGGEGEIARVRQDDLLAALGIEHDPGALELFGIIIEAAHGEAVGRMEAVARGGVAGDQIIDLESDDCRLFGFRTEGADDRLQRPHPFERARLALNAELEPLGPSASIWARRSRG
jgi:hypothetical protein